MRGEAKGFFEKDKRRKEVSVKKAVGKGGPRFWFKEMTPESPQLPKEEEDDKTATEEAVAESTTEEVIPVMSEVDPEERETGHKMWLSQKITSLEKENEDLKRALQEIGTTLSLQETATRGVVERCAKFEAAIIQIADSVQQQNAAIESSRAMMSILVEEANTHRDNFQKVGTLHACPRATM